MKKLILLLTLFASLISSAQIVSTTVPVTQSGFKINCAIYTPVSYTVTKKYPLIIFGHGTGEAGTDVTKLYNQGLPSVLKSGFVPPFECIIVCPQATSYGVNPVWLPFILADIEKRYSVDTSNIFLTGLSAGGWMCYGSVFNVAADYGKNFKGIVVLSGATQDITKTNYDWIKTSPVPVLAIIGGSDLSYVDQNKTVVSEINKRVANDAEIFIRPGIGHGGWTDIYNGTYKMPDGTTVWDWMKSKMSPTAIVANVIVGPTVVKEITIQVMSDGSVKIKQ